VGGSVYNFTESCFENQLAGFYKRTVNTDGSITTARQNSDPMLKQSDRAIVDAVIISSPPDHRVVVLVGKSTDISQPTLPYTGIYVTNDGGATWQQGTFTVQSQMLGKQTLASYENSLIPGLKRNIDGTVGSLFDGHFTLASAGGSLVYLWLESKNASPYGGGLFISTNNGANWAKGQDPGVGDIYYGPGSLKYLGNEKLALAFRDFRLTPNGLYIGTINRSSNGGVSWTAFGGFTSAEHFDVQGDLWAVYGKQGGDKYDQIYRSTNNGSNWERIPTGAINLPYFPKVHSLRIRQAPNDNEPWIATSGQGVWVYKQFDPTYKILTTNARRGWNIASIPLNVNDNRCSTLWQNSYPNVWGFDAAVQNYYQITNLINGFGYWVNFPVEQTITYVGKYLNSKDIPVYKGWNMIGSIEQDIPKSKIYSNPLNIVISNYYGFDGQYYNSDIIEPGKGYWLKVNTNGTITLDKNSTYSGSQYQCSDDSLPNPTGAPSIPILASPSNGSTGISYYPTLRWNRPDTTSLTYRLRISTNSCFTNLIYDYQGLTDTSIQVGLSYGTKYYWRVNASNNVTSSSCSNTWNFTTISAPHIDPCDPVVSSLTSLDKITITDADGNSQSMFIRNGGRGINLGTSDFDMPLVPPKGMFNVRFQSNKFVETNLPNGKIKKMPIMVKNARYPLKIGWDIKGQNNTKIWLTRPGSGEDKILLTGNGNLSIESTQNDILFVEAQSALPRPCELYKTSFEENIPKEFQLYQNYPNPFHPSAVIKYDLPTNGYVSLKIYDVLGREVVKLVDGFLEAGYKSVQFNSDNLPTGVYFYRFMVSSSNPLNAINYTSIKKMLLIR
jgi:hypothetical protein